MPFALEFSRNTHTVANKDRTDLMNVTLNQVRLERLILRLSYKDSVLLNTSINFQLQQLQQVQAQAQEPVKQEIPMFSEKQERKAKLALLGKLGAQPSEEDSDRVNTDDTSNSREKPKTPDMKKLAKYAEAFKLTKAPSFQRNEESKQIEERVNTSHTEHDNFENTQIKSGNELLQKFVVDEEWLPDLDCYKVSSQGIQLVNYFKIN